MDEVLSVAPSDSELESRARSLLRWKIRFNSVHVAAVSGHVTLSGDDKAKAPTKKQSLDVWQLVGSIEDRLRSTNQNIIP